MWAAAEEKNWQKSHLQVNPERNLIKERLIGKKEEDGYGFKG